MVKNLFVKLKGEDIEKLLKAQGITPKSITIRGDDEIEIETDTDLTAQQKAKVEQITNKKFKQKL
jgi:hypothetical protein